MHVDPPLQKCQETNFPLITVGETKNIQAINYEKLREIFCWIVRVYHVYFLSSGICQLLLTSITENRPWRIHWLVRPELSLVRWCMVMNNPRPVFILKAQLWTLAKIPSSVFQIPKPARHVLRTWDRMNRTDALPSNQRPFLCITNWRKRIWTGSNKRRTATLSWSISSIHQVNFETDVSEVCLLPVLCNSFPWTRE